MRRGQLANMVRLVHRGGDLVDGVARARLVGANRAPAAGHDLQEVDPLLEQPARLALHAIDAIGFAVTPPEVATGHGQRRTAHQQTRTGKQTQSRRVAQGQTWSGCARRSHVPS